jgi:hypothetical protein
MMTGSSAFADDDNMERTRHMTRKGFDVAGFDIDVDAVRERNGGT